MTKLNLLLFYSISLLIFSCSSIWKIGDKKMTNTSPSENSETSKCSYNKGFSDSINNLHPDDLCFLLKDDKYRRGYSGGNSYLSKDLLKESIQKSLNEKSKNFDRLMRSSMASYFEDAIINEKMNEISEMKKSLSEIESEMTDLKNNNIRL